MNSAEINARYQEWLLHAAEPDVLADLECCKADDKALEDRFYRDLEFGTGGLRGVLGGGTNRMNIYTVAKATRGLAQYLVSHFENPSCAIAYDSRIKSDVFARTAAAALADAGVTVWLYPELMPTPMLSFAVRHLHCSGGIVITASHNPAEYNGYKVYGDDGCQITLEAASAVQKCIAAQPDFIGSMPDFDAYFASGKIRMIGAETTEPYFAAVKSLNVCAPAVPLNVVYTPLNGTGCKPVQRILKELGNIRVTVVPEQEMPDGHFPTCPYPNPEIEEAMRLAMKLALETGADFCLATDPDCDRVGAGVPDGKGGVQLITGNEMGAMLLRYLCEQRIARGTMPEHPVAVKTIVTTEIAAQVAAEYGVELRNVLTGFKFIGEQIGLLEEKGEADRFIFGFEESYGYLAGSFVRDKDAVIASMLICEMAAYYKSKGKTLLQVLQEIYHKYGYYKSRLLSFKFPGADGMHHMEQILEQLRRNARTEFLGRSVVKLIDYLNDETGLPKSNVLSFDLDDRAHIVVRPSGTEPKLKLYVTAVGAENAECDEKLAALCAQCEDFIH